MSKSISRDTRNGRFIVGRLSGSKFNAVEGLRETARVARLSGESIAAGESGDAKRARILRTFKK